MPLNKIQQQMLEQAVQDKLNKVDEHTTQLAKKANQFNSQYINIKYPPAPLVAAKGDGVTDDKAAFQGSVDYLASNGGGLIYAPQSIYLLKSGIKWKSKISMVGAGIGQTVFKVSGSYFDMIYNVDGASNGTGTTFLEDCRFEDMEFDGSGFTLTESSINGKAFFITYMRRARFHNLYIHDTIGTGLGCDFLTDSVISNVVVVRSGRNFSNGGAGGGGGQSGIGIGSCSLPEEPVVITNCHVYNCGNYGIFVETQSNPSGIKSHHARIMNNYCSGNRIGIGNKGSGGTLISGNSIIKSTSHGLHLGQEARDDQVFNNKIGENAGSGIYVDTTYKNNLSIIGNDIYKNTQRGILLDNNIDKSKYINIQGNKIYENGFAGIELGGDQVDVTINNNTIYNNAKTVSATYAAGIMLSALLDNFNIQNNLLLDDQATQTQIAGIKTAAGTALTNGLISGNNVIGLAYNTAFNIASGTKTNVKVKNNGGYETESNGSGTIADLSSYVDITFPTSLASTPTTIILTPAANAQIWYSNATRLGFRVNRSGTTGVLSFGWKAEI